jgi:hypothetical protein
LAQDIHFTRATTPLMASLVLDNVKADRFLLDLPRLTAMSLDFVEVGGGAGARVWLAFTFAVSFAFACLRV